MVFLQNPFFPFLLPEDVTKQNFGFASWKEKGEKYRIGEEKHKFNNLDFHIAVINMKWVSFQSAYQYLNTFRPYLMAPVVSLCITIKSHNNIANIGADRQKNETEHSRLFGRWHETNRCLKNTSVEASSAILFDGRERQGASSVWRHRWNLSCGVTAHCF